MAVRIKEWDKPYTAGVGIEITDNKVINVLLRELNNLIMVNWDNELYVDLQLDDGIEPTDDFPVGVTTGKILQADWWQQSGIILNWKTTSGDYVRLIYANDGKLYYDPWTWVWREIWWDCHCHSELILDYIQLEQDQNDDTMIVANVWVPTEWTVINASFLFENAILEKISFDNGVTSMDLIYPTGHIYPYATPGGTTPHDEFNMGNGLYSCWFTWIVINWKVYVWDFWNTEQAE